MKKEEYLRCVTDQIRCKKACPGIEKELEDHITDQAEMYLKKGMTEEQALKKAIAEMGDPVQVGVPDPQTTDVLGTCIAGRDTGNHQYRFAVWIEKSWI